jgi:OmpA-OmpF porin, OOP family
MPQPNVRSYLLRSTIPILISAGTLSLAVCCSALALTDIPTEVKPVTSISVTPYIGGYFFSSSDGLNPTALYGVRFSYDTVGNSVVDTLGVEGTVDYFSTTTRTGSKSVDGYLLRLNAVYSFTPRNKLVPFFAIGLGDRQVNRDSGSDNRGILDYGLGLKYYIRDYLALRVDARQLFVYKDVSTTNNFEFATGLTYLFGKDHKKVVRAVKAPTGEPEKPLQPETLEKLGAYGPGVIGIPAEPTPFEPEPAPPFKKGLAFKPEAPKPSEEVAPVPAPAEPLQQPAAAPAQAQPSTEPKPEAAPAAKPSTEPKPEAAPEAKPSIETKPEAAPPAKPSTETKPEGAPPQSEPATELKPEPATELKPEAAPAQKVPAQAPATSAAPVRSPAQAAQDRPATPPKALQQEAPAVSTHPTEPVPAPTTAPAAPPEIPAAASPAHPESREAQHKVVKRVTVEFQFSSNELEPRYQKVLREVAAAIRSKGSVPYNITVQGHTDNIGGMAGNIALSLRRAESVKNALVKLGLPAERITTNGFGFSKPIADNATAKGRQRNRRAVAVIVIEITE